MTLLRGYGMPVGPARPPASGRAAVSPSVEPGHHPEGVAFRRGVVGAAAAGLPLPGLVAGVRSAPRVVCAVTAIAANGRVADRSCLRVLAWSPATRLRITARPDVIGLAEAADGEDGEERVDGDGHLRFRTLTRRLAGFGPGERLLLVAEPDERVLTLYTMAAVATVVGMLPDLDPPAADGAQR